MSKQGSIRYQIERELKSKCRFGESRHKAKIKGDAHKYIYSFGTMKTYLKQLNYMVKWANENNIKLKSVDDFKVYGDDWLKWCIEQNQSAWTIATRRSALCKLCDVEYSFFKTEIPKKKRQNVKRSRDMSKSLKHFSESRNCEQVTFCKCSGLRLSELKSIRGNDLYFDDSGNPCLKVDKGTKGGKIRTVKLTGSPEERELVISLCRQSGNEKVFKEVNENANTHGYRAMYAQRLYNSVERELDTIPRNEKMYCRKDKKGIVYDKKALKICSENLGHNRIDVCSLSYLYNKK